jgi:hypothetical protein
VEGKAGVCDGSAGGRGEGGHGGHEGHDTQKHMRCLLAALMGVGPSSHVLNPQSLAEALARPDGEQWAHAVSEKVGSLLAFDVWDACDLPEGKKALPSHFLFDPKRDGRYKVRLVAGGHRQEAEVDYGETYAPVCSYRMMRMHAHRSYDACSGCEGGSDTAICEHRTMWSARRKGKSAHL